MKELSVTTAEQLFRLRSEDDAIGLLFEGQSWTWRQALVEAEHRADLMRALPDTGPLHIGILMENTPEYLFLLAGAALAGAVVVGINPTRRGEELAADVRATDCQLLITESLLAPLIA